jgi:hypothetical protein
MSMWESKWVKAVVIITFISMAIAIAALLNPGFGQALHDFGFKTLGPAVMGGLTLIVCAPLAWGGVTLLYGAVVWIAIGLTWVAIYFVAYKVAWQKYIAKPKGTPVPQEPAYVPRGTTLSTSELPQPTPTQPATPPEQKQEVAA